VLGWEPEISLEQGLTHTYGWIESQVQKKLSLSTTNQTEIAEACEKK